MVTDFEDPDVSLAFLGKLDATPLLTRLSISIDNVHLSAFLKYSRLSRYPSHLRDFDVQVDTDYPVDYTAEDLAASGELFSDLIANCPALETIGSNLPVTSMYFYRSLIIRLFVRLLTHCLSTKENLLGFKSLCQLKCLNLDSIVDLPTLNRFTVKEFCELTQAIAPGDFRNWHHFSLNKNELGSLFSRRDIDVSVILEFQKIGINQHSDEPSRWLTTIHQQYRRFMQILRLGAITIDQVGVILHDILHLVNTLEKANSFLNILNWFLASREQRGDAIPTAEFLSYRDSQTQVLCSSIIQAPEPLAESLVVNAILFKFNLNHRFEGRPLSFFVR